jgi:hypothetical protein
MANQNFIGNLSLTVDGVGQTNAGLRTFKEDTIHIVMMDIH